MEAFFFSLTVTLGIVFYLQFISFVLRDEPPTYSRDFFLYGHELEEEETEDTIDIF